MGWSEFPGHELLFETARSVLRPFRESDFLVVLHFYADEELRRGPGPSPRFWFCGTARRSNLRDGCGELEPTVARAIRIARVPGGAGGIARSRRPPCAPRRRSRRRLRRRRSGRRCCGTAAPR